MLGIDIVEIDRIAAAAKREHFLTRTFTETEIEYFRSHGEDYSSLAGAWCVKEAVAKALGCGVVFALTDIGVRHDELGKPTAVLKGKAAEILGKRKVEISITHCKTTAAAVALIREE